MSIGSRLKDARVKCGFTQAILAKKIGVQQKDVSRWENGQRTPNVDTLGKICKACSVTTDSIIFDNGVVNHEQE